MTKAFALLALLAASPALAQPSHPCAKRDGGPTVGASSTPGISWQWINETCDADNQLRVVVIARADAKVRATAKAQIDSGVRAPADPLKATLSGDGASIAFTSPKDAPALGVRYSLTQGTLDVLYETREKWTLLPRIQLDATDSVLVVLVDGSAGAGGTPDVVGRVTLPRTPPPGPTTASGFLDQLAARNATIRNFISGR